MDNSSKAIWLLGCVFCGLMVGFSLYHANKPIFEMNVVTDNFDDQITGVFPAGWFSGVNPQNIRVEDLNSNKVMRIYDDDVGDVTEVMRKFKKTSKGTIECDVMIDSKADGFVVHIPQRDADYNPYDDIIIVFLDLRIYIVEENNIIEFEENGEIFRLIDEWKIEENNDPIGIYNINEWIHLKIEFTTEHFKLAINEDDSVEYQYPKYNPEYFCSIYFWTLIEPIDFNVYVDNVDITLLETVDSGHPLNYTTLIVFGLIIFLPVYIFSFSKLKD